MTNRHRSAGYLAILVLASAMYGDSSGGGPPGAPIAILEDVCNAIEQIPNPDDRLEIRRRVACRYSELGHSHEAVTSAMRLSNDTKALRSKFVTNVEITAIARALVKIGKIDSARQILDAFAQVSPAPASLTKREELVADLLTDEGRYAESMTVLRNCRLVPNWEVLAGTGDVVGAIRLKQAERSDSILDDDFIDRLCRLTRHGKRDAAEKLVSLLQGGRRDRAIGTVALSLAVAGDFEAACKSAELIGSPSTRDAVLSKIAALARAAKAQLQAFADMDIQRSLEDLPPDLPPASQLRLDIADVAIQRGHGDQARRIIDAARDALHSGKPSIGRNSWSPGRMHQVRRNRLACLMARIGDLDQALHLAGERRDPGAELKLTADVFRHCPTAVSRETLRVRALELTDPVQRAWGLFGLAQGDSGEGSGLAAVTDFHESDPHFLYHDAAHLFERACKIASSSDSFSDRERIVAIHQLELRGVPTGARDRLFRIATSDPSIDVRLQALRALQWVGALPNAMASDLVQDLPHAPVPCQLAAVRLLMNDRDHDNQIVNALSNLLGDPTTMVCLDAVILAGELADRARPLLQPLKLLLHHSEERVRFYAAKAILHCQNDDAIAMNTLRELVSSSDKWLAAKACAVLGVEGAGAVGTADCLRNAMSDDDQYLQLHAADALYRITSDPKASEAIVSRVSSDGRTHELREMARQIAVSMRVNKER